jgi:Predicted hydrolases or acyltransferases (alpha/beta hydrolase superfamily)
MFDFDADDVISAAQASPAFMLAARFWTGTALFRMGDDGWLLRMNDGTIEAFRRAEVTGQADIMVNGPAASWAKLLQRVPPPGYQDPFYNDGRSGFRMEGDMVAAVAPFYHGVQEFIEILRTVRSGPKTEVAPAEVDRKFDNAVGRYMYARIEGVQYRIYFEESGQGKIPLLLQHSAGADGRQWRHLLEDPDIQKNYRLIAYDLPFHGKSLPPATIKWWEQPYILTKSFLMEAVIAIADTLELDRPVFMGCSVGGMLAPDLAFYHPGKFRAVIAINGGLAMGKTNPLPGMERTFGSPQVGSHWKASFMRGQTAPTSPDAFRRETTWVYSQGAPPVLEGDIYYHMIDHDLTYEQAVQIDTARTAVYLLTGEYDFLATETGTARLAQAVKGSRFQILPGLGHFGSAENPDGFKQAVVPVLEEIASARVAA